MFYFVITLCVLCTVDAKAFQPDDGAYNGEYDHIYQNMYLSEYPQKYQPPPNDPNSELRYIPHIDGQPIFIPPVESVHYQTAIPVSSHRRKVRPKHGNTEYPDLKTIQKKILENSDVDSDMSKGHNIPEQEAFSNKPYGLEDKRKQKIKKMSHGKYSQKLHTSNKVKYSNKEKKELKKEKVTEKRGDYPDKEINFVDVPIVHAKSIIPEQDYDIPLVESLQTSNEAEYEDSQIPEEINGIMNDQIEYEYDNPEVVDADLKSKPIGENIFEEGESIKVASFNSHESDHEIPGVEDQDYDFDDVEVLSNQKVKKQTHDYHGKKTFQKHTKDVVKNMKGVNYHTPVVIKEQEKKNGHKTKAVIKTPVKFPSVHMSDYAYEASKKTSPEVIKEPVKSPVKVIPVKKPHFPEKADKDLKYKDTLIKQESVKANKKPDVHSKPVKQKPIKIKEYEDSGLIDKLDYSDLDDDEEYDTPVDTINELKTEDFDHPLVVEALVKKEPITQEEDYADYDSPKVVEALTKKKPSKKDNHKEIKNSNIKMVHKNDKQKVIKGNGEDYHKKTYLYVDFKDLDKDSKVIELHHQREDPVFFDLNQDENGIKETLSNTDFTNPENDPENINENDSLDNGSGINSGRSGHFEDARNMFLKSNVWSIVSNFHTQERNKFKTCKTPNNEPGNCMPIQMCPVPNLDLTLDDFMKKVCTIDNIFIGICCPEFPAETLKVKWDNLTDSSIDILEKKNLEPKECGEIQSSVDNLNSWPWMIPLISASTRRIFCGGVLIKEQYVLTAAHCTKKIPHNQILAILGPMSSKQDPTNQEFAVVEIKRHAQYNPRTMQNDIALLKLSKPVVINDLRRFICLPKEEANFVGEEALLLGWQGSFEASKNEESLRVISPEDCRKGVKTVIGPNVLCTEPRTEDIMCNLDSGAPLIVKEDGKFSVIGVLSWNRNDCDSDFPAIFTRVSHFRKWIDNHAT